MGNLRTRRLAGEISCFEVYRYAQLQNRELKTELLRVSFIYFVKQELRGVLKYIGVEIWTPPLETWLAP